MKVAPWVDVLSATYMNEGSQSLSWVQKTSVPAFEVGADRSRFCKVGLALVDYARNRVEEARGQLAELEDSLRTGDPLREYAASTIEMIDDRIGQTALAPTW